MQMAQCADAEADMVASSFSGPLQQSGDPTWGWPNSEIPNRASQLVGSRTSVPYLDRILKGTYKLRYKRHMESSKTKQAVKQQNALVRKLS